MHNSSTYNNILEKYSKYKIRYSKHYSHLIVKNTVCKEYKLYPLHTVFLYIRKLLQLS